MLAKGLMDDKLIEKEIKGEAKDSSIGVGLLQPQMILALLSPTEC